MVKDESAGGHVAGRGAHYEILPPRTPQAALCHDKAEEIERRVMSDFGSDDDLDMGKSKAWSDGLDDDDELGNGRIGAVAAKSKTCSIS